MLEAPGGPSAPPPGSWDDGRDSSTAPFDGPPAVDYSPRHNNIDPRALPSDERRRDSPTDAPPPPFADWPFEEMADLVKVGVARSAGWRRRWVAFLGPGDGEAYRDPWAQSAQTLQGFLADNYFDFEQEGWVRDFHAYGPDAANGPIDNGAPAQATRGHVEDGSLDTEAAMDPRQMTIEDWQQNQHQFNHLSALPRGWIRIRSRSNPDLIYHYSVNTGRTQFEVPEESDAPPMEPGNAPPMAPSNWSQGHQGYQRY